MNLTREATLCQNILNALQIVARISKFCCFQETKQTQVFLLYNVFTKSSPFSQLISRNLAKTLLVLALDMLFLCGVWVTSYAQKNLQTSGGVCKVFLCLKRMWRVVWAHAGWRVSDLGNGTIMSGISELTQNFAKVAKILQVLQEHSKTIWSSWRKTFWPQFGFVSSGFSSKTA